MLSKAVFIKGLTDDDALALWREFICGERSGTSEQLLPLFRAFDNYPLLLRALWNTFAMGIAAHSRQRTAAIFPRSPTIASPLRHYGLI